METDYVMPPQPQPVPPPFRTWEEYRASKAVPPHFNTWDDYKEAQKADRGSGEKQTANKPIPSVREKILDEAKVITTKNRNLSYGEPEDNFKRIARHWKVFFLNAYGLTIDISPADVAILMDLMKTARLEFDVTNRDSWVDKAGYAACGAECAAPKGERW